MQFNEKFDLVFSHSVIDHVYDIDLFLSKVVDISTKYVYISAYYGYFPNLSKHEMKYHEADGYFLNCLSIPKIKEILLNKGLNENEFKIRPQMTSHKDIVVGTVIEIERLI